MKKSQYSNVNSYTEMGDERKTMQFGTSRSSGASYLDQLSDQRLKCLRVIVDIVLSLSDEEWESVTEDLPCKITKLTFVALCTKIMNSGSAFVEICLPVIETVGIQSVPPQKKKSEETQSATATSAQRSPVNPSKFIGNIAEAVIIKMKNAMQEAIQSANSIKMSRSEKVKTKHSPVTDDMRKSLSDKSQHFLTAENNIAGEKMYVLCDPAKQTGQDTAVISEEILFTMKTPSKDLEGKIGLTSKAVSADPLISAGVWEMDRTTFELQNSRACQTSLSLDNMLEATSQAGFPVASLFSRIESASRDIKMSDKDMLESHSQCDHSKSYTPGGSITSELSPKSHRKIHGVLEALENLLSVIRGSFKRSLPQEDEKNEDASVPGSFAANEETVPGFAESQVENLFREQLHERATQIVSDILLETVEKFSSEEDVLGNRLDADMSVSTPVKSTASNITEIFLESLERSSNHGNSRGSSTEPASSQTKFISAAQKLYRRVYMEVCGWLLGLRESEMSQISQPVSLRSKVPAEHIRSEEENGHVISSCSTPLLKQPSGSMGNLWDLTTSENDINTAADITWSSAVSERSTQHNIPLNEKSTIDELNALAPKSVRLPSERLTFATDQLQNQISDETVQSNAQGIATITSIILRAITGQSHDGKSSSDSVLETACLRRALVRNFVHDVSPLVNVFVEESIKCLLQHLLRLQAADQSASLNFSDQDIPGPRADFDTQKSNANKPDLQHAFTDAVKHFTKTLEDLVMKYLHQTSTTSGDVEDATASPVQKKGMGVNYGLKYKSPDEFPTYPNNPTNNSDVGRKAGLIGSGIKHFFTKKSNKVGPVGLKSDKISISSSNLQEASPGEQKD